jgi:hypothetical protein
LCAAFLAQPAVSLAQQPEAAAQPDTEYTAKGKRDPFVDLLPKDLPPGALPVAEDENLEPPEMKIQGIFWGGKFSQAIINDKVYKAGDVLENATIVRIEKEGVTIRLGSREFRVAAPASEVAPSTTSPEAAGQQGKGLDLMRADTEPDNVLKPGSVNEYKEDDHDIF